MRNGVPLFVAILMFVSLIADSSQASTCEYHTIKRSGADDVIRNQKVYLCLGEDGTWRAPPSSPSFFQGNSTTIDGLTVWRAHHNAYLTGNYTPWFENHGQITVYLRTKEEAVYRGAIDGIKVGAPRSKNLARYFSDKNNPVVLFVETDGPKQKSTIEVIFGNGFGIHQKVQLEEETRLFANSVVQRELLLARLDMEVIHKERDLENKNRKMQQIDRRIKELEDLKNAR
jgi:hypothetical protein